MAFEFTSSIDKVLMTPLAHINRTGCSLYIRAYGDQFNIVWLRYKGFTRGMTDLDRKIQSDNDMVYIYHDHPVEGSDKSLVGRESVFDFVLLFPNRKYDAKDIMLAMEKDSSVLNPKHISIETISRLGLVRLSLQDTP